MNIEIVREKFVIMLSVMLVLLPAQVTFSQVAGVESGGIVTLSTDDKKEPVAENNQGLTEPGKIQNENLNARETVSTLDASDNISGTDETGDSTLMWLGIGAGVTAVIVGAVVLSSSGSSDGSSESVYVEPVSTSPPSADSLVDPWSAHGSSPGSGKTYTGTFHLYAGGSLGYDLQKSDGEHLVGGGSWSVSGYQLKVYTDHGSHYIGNFTPAETYNSITLNADNGWYVKLTR